MQQFISLQLSSVWARTHPHMHAHTEKGETNLINEYNDRSQLASKGEESLGELFGISEPLSQETGKH